MANQVPLNSNTHKNTRVITSRGAEYGENVHFVPVVADELPNLVLDFPVCLIKNPDNDQFGLYALLGFEPGENLYLEGNRWNASYVPAHFRRQPFMVAFTGPDPSPENTAISIDMDHKRVQEEEGERLFNDDGTPTPYLEEINRLLAGMMNGLESSKAFIQTLSELDLVEPANLRITFGSGEQKNIEGLFSINDQKLAELPEDKVQMMHKRGYLQASTLIIASMGQMQRLINLKNEQQHVET